MATEPERPDDPEAAPVGPRALDGSAAAGEQTSAEFDSEAAAGSEAGDGVRGPTAGGRGAARKRGKKKRGKAPWWELPVLIVVAVVVAMLIKTFLVQPYYIPSASMEQTLHGCPGCSGDRILVNKPIYDFRDPHPGDIVVFKAPDGWDTEPIAAPPSNPILKGIRWAGQLIGLVPPDENDLVKRVIAVGGQTVQCCDSQGRVQVSDSGPGGPFHSLNEPFVYEDLSWVPTDRPGQPVSGNDQRTFGPVTVPKGRLWVMGDHRTVSADSRYHYTFPGGVDVGNAEASTVSTNAVIGKAVLIIWPYSRWRTLGTPATFTQIAEGLGGAGIPVLGAGFLVLPVWGLRRRRRR
jgi:signal peptidase I